VAGFHGEAAAKEATDNFQQVFRDRKAPTAMPELKLAAGTRALHAVLTEAQLAPSRSEAERLIKQGAVEVNGEIEKDWKRVIELKAGDALPMRVGKKKFLKIVGA
jgi:tyrosyl-tRNA synthetase